MKSEFPVLGNKTSLTDVCGCVLKIYMFIQMTSPINCLPVNPCLRVSFWGNPNIWEDGAPYGSSQPHGAPLPSFLLGSANPVFFFLAVLGLCCCPLAALLGAHKLTSCGMWDLNSQTRAETHVPCIGRRILNPWTVACLDWTAREVPCPVNFLLVCGLPPSPDHPL